MRVYNFDNIIPNNSVMNTNLQSRAMQIGNYIGYAIQVVFTGTPTGTFSLQGSNDEVLNKAFNYQPTNWTTLSNSSNAVSGPGSFIWNIQEPYYTWVKLVYTDGSGGASTAILTVSTFNAKGF